MKLLRINWIDTASTRGWRNDDDKQHGTIKCVSVGYEIEGDKAAIHLVQSISDNEGRSEVISIPKGTITKRRILRHK